MDNKGFNHDAAVKGSDSPFTLMQTNTISIIDKVNRGVQALDSCISKVMNTIEGAIDNILANISSLNFEAYADKDGKVSMKAKIVACIDEILKLAQKLNSTIKIEGGEIWLYVGTHWARLHNDHAKNFLGDVALKMGLEYCDAKFYSLQEKLLKQLQSAGYSSPVTKSNRNETFLNCRNFTLVISASEITTKEHSPADDIRYCLDYDYNPQALCLKFDTYLNRVLPDSESRTLLLEAIGYALIKKLTLEKIVILYGSGKNGKSVLFNIVRALYGQGNVSSFSLEELTYDKNYSLIEVQHKLLNFNTDISTKVKVEVMKKLASNEPVTARRIYGSPMELTDYPKFFFSANDLPANDTELTDSYFRRFLFILFSQTIMDEEVDTNLAQKICEDELPGILNLVIGGTQRLLKNGRFSPCKASETVLQEYREDLNPIEAFIKCENYAKSTLPGMSLAELYNNFCAYCSMNLRDQMGSKVFSRNLQALGYVVKPVGGKARMVFIAPGENNQL